MIESPLPKKIKKKYQNGGVNYLESRGWSCELTCSLQWIQFEKTQWAVNGNSVELLTPSEIFFKRKK